ncbi:MAG: DegT/DnrJ/EryC1/StrS aminotransferase family protein [SAR202 cluster bacterium]|nr:DegT/DnrJ/EryC1/StrS aminotransferase family protein [SAR202 cluster bacterium]|tara:strand:+ start:2036 stop:3148 length:1113 start_codon:yes stop_codon:yes gene_type:complete
MIPVCEPTLTGKELEYVTECLTTNWISSRGRFLEEFQDQFAEYCSCKYGIATTNGTTALHLALAALEIGEGDEVIVPAFTMAACIDAIMYTGAKPVLVDATVDTWSMDVSKVEEKISSKTKAIMAVHIYGHPCDMDHLAQLAKRYNIAILEDAAEAHGAEYKGQKIGSIGDISAFSFYANKIITTGEGGMVVTNNEELADRARRLADLAHSPDQRFVHTEVGFNYRMTNMQAALGVAQMTAIDEFVEARRTHAHSYNQQLQEVPGLTFPVEKSWAKNVYWMYGILVDEAVFGISRDELMASLREKGIETRAFFYPMHQQPGFQDQGLFHQEEYPVAEKLGMTGLYLPSSSGLTESQIAEVCAAVVDIAEQ